MAKAAAVQFACSECGYATLVGRAEKDENLAEKLGVRLDIPGSLLRELIGKKLGTEILLDPSYGMPQREPIDFTNPFGLLASLTTPASRTSSATGKPRDSGGMSRWSL